jgi:hypothetical protein
MHDDDTWGLIYIHHAKEYGKRNSKIAQDRTMTKRHCKMATAIVRWGKM